MFFYVLNIMLFFFFKQKTAYEMRVSDWSSDVCSSDLKAASQLHREQFTRTPPHPRNNAAGHSGTGDHRRHRAEQLCGQTGLERTELIRRTDEEDRKSTRLNSSH